MLHMWQWSSSRHCCCLHSTAQTCRWCPQAWDALAERLSPLLSLRTESNVRLHAAARVPDTLADAPGTELAEDALAFFIDFDSWGLDVGRTTAGHEHALAPGAHLIPEALLHFVAYVPQRVRQPMRITGPHTAGSDGARAFVTRDWGGVIILDESVDRQDADLHSTPGSVSQHGMAIFHGVAMQQFRSLLGLPAANTSDWRLTGNLLVESPGAQAVTLWELDALLRQRYLQLMHDTADAAQTLVHLVRALTARQGFGR
jgi:Phosphatidylinositol-glycan biosynthesis class S protein